jgi:hypothetical protein
MHWILSNCHSYVSDTGFPEKVHHEIMLVDLTDSGAWYSVAPRNSVAGLR